MKKAIIVEYSFMTRVVIDVDKENLEEVVRLSKDNIQAKIDNNELAENLSEWYDDEECPYDTVEDEDIRDVHRKVREILQKYGNEEYGDCIIDELSFAFGYPTTVDVEESCEEEMTKTMSNLKEGLDKLWHKQIELQHQMQGSGLNIVICGNCETLIIHECDERGDIDCHGCGENMDKSDCPDYFYSGMPLR